MASKDDAGLRIDIVNGPNKWDLMLSLFDNSTSRPRIPEFHLKSGRVFRLLVNEVGRESGSGDNWLISGFIVLDDGSCGLGFNGYYSTKDRDGWLEWKT